MTLKSPIQPLCFPREQDGFSATAARAALRGGEDADRLLPPAVLPFYQTKGFADFQNIESLILGHFRLSDEGGRFTEAALKAGNLTDFFANLSNKKHTAASDRREIIRRLCCLDGYSKTPLYTQLLAANNRGRRALRAFDPAFPLLTKPARYHRLEGGAIAQFLQSLKAARLYALCLPEGRRGENELLSSPFILESEEK